MSLVAVSLTGDLDVTADDTSYQIFCSFDAGFSITDGMQIRADIMMVDKDGTGTTRRRGFAELNQENNPAFWGIWVLSGTLVPGTADSIAPVVGATTVTAITSTAATGSATTNEASQL